MSTEVARDPLREVQASNAGSKLKLPTKVTKADFPVQTLQVSDLALPAESMKENLPAGAATAAAKRKREPDARENPTRKQKTEAEPVAKPAAATRSMMKKTPLSETMGATAKAPVASRLRDRPLNQTVGPKPAPTRAAAPAAAAVKTKTGARPAWDTKGRLEDVEKLIPTMKAELDLMRSQLKDKESVITEISHAKTTLDSDYSHTRHEMEEQQQQRMALQRKITDMLNDHTFEMEQTQRKIKTLEMQYDTTSADLSGAKAEILSFRLTIDRQTGQLAAQSSELDALKALLKASQESNAAKGKEIDGLNDKVDMMTRTISDLEAKIRDDEALRKKLHNTIQELKGNIRVFCRIRPFVGDESGTDGQLTANFEFPPNTDRSLDIVTEMSSATGKDCGKRTGFTFDKVFQPNSTQKQVFEEISQLVQSSLDGYNTCIFAYGQTGSGKTYTMEGAGISTDDIPIVADDSRGMIPRAVEQVFASAEVLKDKGWKYDIEASFIEIYNETLRDLLASGKAADEAKYDIKHDAAKGTTSVANAKVVKVERPAQVYELLRKATKNRAVARTLMNERSSRSHSVFQLRIAGVNSFTGETTNGLLNLIDLAGSERLDQSGATGQRLKETQAINKSLSALGDVIAALANSTTHVPYRNSKLTFLLQNSLGGNSKTLMFVNVSPRATDLQETISSLRFAQKVNACEIGTAKKQSKVDLRA
eukprot:TRINITY_DN808_c0_g2_i3.p1 TRINITY_DN808_c0_g2~~TRINITY_DN808_c0_g2_i3.p1  ORF type:complete len:708 (-),score=304.84 TRINITY_DN808_c0_g2_i3:54-2177(-)